MDSGSQGAGLAGAAGTAELHPAFRQPRYRFRRRVLTLLGSRIDVFDDAQILRLHCYQKAFRLREDIRLYSDPSGAEELLAIQARQIIDFSAAYDVWDQSHGGYVGLLRRRGWTSLVRDLWEICDEAGNRIAQVQEDSTALALVRRFLTNLIPQTFHVVLLSGEVAATFRQHFNPFVYWLTVDLAGGARPRLDPRLILAAATLIAALEGRQN